MQNELRKLADPEFESKIEEDAKKERHATTVMLHNLREAERRRTYAKLGYPSLFEYAVKRLGYSEAAAQRRIASMRLLTELPELESKIDEGKLSLSTVARAQRFFRQEAKAEKALTTEQKKEIIEKLESKSARQVERELLTLSSEPELHFQERARPISETHTALNFLADEKLMEGLEKLKGLLAHSHPNLTLAELVAYMTKLALEKLDPAREPKNTRATKSVPTSEVRTETRHIPAALKREIWKRDQGRCTLCGTRHALEVDHILAWAKGGRNELGNLRLVCRAHNQLFAIRTFGERKMAEHIPKLR